MRDQRAPIPWHRRRWAAAFFCFGLALLCYWPALSGGILWDDRAHITRPDLQSWTGLVRIWTDVRATQQYYPLLHSAFWVEHWVWGDATLGYHLVNVALHAAAALLLIRLLRRLQVPGAELAGVIFIVHPVGVESVAWISEQKNTLSLVLYLMAARRYLQFDQARDRPAAGPPSARLYLGALGWFVLALLTKSVTATLPAALLVAMWWQRGRLAWRRDGAPLIPWFAAAIASGLLTAWVERVINGAMGPAFDLTLLQRCLLAGRIIWFYVGKLLWPTPLIFFYPHWDVKSAAAGWVGYLIAVAALTTILWVVRRRWRGPLAAWLFFIGSLFPALGFFAVYPFIYSYVADHFLYQASIGIIAAAAAGAALLMARSARAIRGLLAAFTIVAIGILILMTRAQSRHYRDLVTLYTITIEQNPGCFMAHNNLGIEFEQSGRPAAAEAEYAAAIALQPDLPDAHYNLGHLWLQRPGKLEDAIVQFREALRLKPNYPEAHDNLGNALTQLPGRLDDAIAQYREALRLRPDYPEARHNLANVLSYGGRSDEAITAFQELLRRRPNDGSAHFALGDLYLKTPGRVDEAIGQYREALRLAPDSPEVHLHLAVALLKGADGTREAVTHLETALRLRPGWAPAQRLLGLIRASGP
jgi:tetratricopeptide (TPR) repeat protein